MRHGRLLRVSELVVVSGAAVEPQHIADLEQLLHHAESAASAAETHAALLDARQKGARAIDLGRASGNRLASTDKPVGSESSDSSFWSTAALWMLT